MMLYAQCESEKNIIFRTHGYHNHTLSNLKAPIMDIAPIPKL